MPSSEKFRDNVVAQFNAELPNGAFRVTILDAMLPELPAPKAKKKK